MERKGPIETIRQAVQARRSIWAFCLDCGHAAMFDPWWLAQQLGEDMKLSEAGERLKCYRCKAVGKAHLVPHYRERPTDR